MLGRESRRLTVERVSGNIREKDRWYLGKASKEISSSGSQYQRVKGSTILSAASFSSANK
jgi:hypothetical protein